MTDTHDETTVTLEAACAAVCTLQKMGYTFEGGALWKPPLGGAPAYTKPYTEWRRGDVLRVIAADYLDPFQVGDEVVHDDFDGDSAPYVVNAKGRVKRRYAMRGAQLEFIRRPA